MFLYADLDFRAIIDSAGDVCAELYIETLSSSSSTYRTSCLIRYDHVLCLLCAESQAKGSTDCNDSVSSA